MKLLVTGGAGFIGSNFIHYWLINHPNDEIINLDKLTYAGNLENLKSIESLANYQFVRSDIIDTKLVDSLTKEIDTIVHFAAESHVDRSIADASAFVRTGVIGVQVLLGLLDDLQQGRPLRGHPAPRRVYLVARSRTQLVGRFQRHGTPFVATSSQLQL